MTPPTHDLDILELAPRRVLPIGLQLAARDLGEDRLLRMGMAYQSATTWHRRRPSLEGAPA